MEGVRASFVGRASFRGEIFLIAMFRLRIIQRVGAGHSKLLAQDYAGLLAKVEQMVLVVAIYVAVVFPRLPRA